MTGPPPPGIPVRRGALAARIRVWFRTTLPSVAPFSRYRIERIETMEVDLRGAGPGGQDELEQLLAELIPPGAELRGYELIA